MPDEIGETRNMNAIESHITVQGKPLCQFAGGRLMLECDCTCGHGSIASARRDIKEIQKHAHTVRAVRGRCPSLNE